MGNSAYYGNPRPANATEAWSTFSEIMRLIGATRDELRARTLGAWLCDRAEIRCQDELKCQ